MASRYLGSKARMVEAIMQAVGAPASGGAFVDPFCGSGSVSEAASFLGWPVKAGDLLTSAAIATAGRLSSHETAPFEGFGGYQNALDRLSSAPDAEGFIWREYSPASAASAGVERRYFTESNARRIDGMRQKIGDWQKSGEITAAETNLLIADLMAASNRVANTAGTYGCFMRRWQTNALKPFEVIARNLRATAPPFSVSVNDARDTAVLAEDVLYLDPPYTKRQYAAYYHVLETIAHGDEPEVVGVAGIRPWRHASSKFCYKAKALDELISVIEGHAARKTFLSYSDEGHMPLALLRDRLETLGSVTVVPMGNIGRYRPNRTASAARSQVAEVLFRLDRTDTQVERKAA